LKKDVFHAQAHLIECKIALEKAKNEKSTPDNP